MTLATSRAKLFARSRLVLPVGVLLTAGILTADVSSSDAAGKRAAAASCTLNVPTRVAISSPYVNPTFTLGADCAAAGVIDARWEAKRADGVVMKKAFFNFDYPASWAVFDSTNLAPWTWHPAGARTRGDATLAAEGEQTPSTVRSEQIQATVPQNAPITDIRMMSKIEALPTDDADCAAGVNSDVYAQRYAIAPHGLINYGGRTGSVQQLNTSTGGWFVVQNFTTDSTGHWRGNVKWPSPVGTTISARVVIYDGQYIFGSISPTYTGGTVPSCSSVAAASGSDRETVLGLIDPKIEASKEDPGPLEPPSGR